MTSKRGTSRQIIACGIAIIFACLLILSAGVAQADLTAGGDIGGTQTTSNTAVSGSTGSLPTGGASGGTGSQTPTNIGESADDYCAQFIYSLPCGHIDPATYKKGGVGCACTTGKLPDGSTIKGTCVYDAPSKKGVCHATPVLGNNVDPNKKTDAPTGMISSPSSGNTTSAKSGTGSTGGSSANGGTPSVSGGTPSVSSGNAAGTGQTGTIGSGATVSPGGTGIAGSGTIGGTIPTNTGYGGNSGVLTNTGAWNPTNSSYSSGRYSGSGGFSAVSAISGFANSIGQSFSNVGNQIIPTGNNWSDVARYQNGQLNAYYLAPPTQNIVINNPVYQAAPYDNYASSSGTFTAQNTSFDQTAADASLKRFIQSVQKMSNSAITGLGDTYRNLSGTQDNVPAEVQSNDGASTYNNAVFDNSITPNGDSSLVGQNTVSQSPDSGTSIADMSEIQTAKAIAQEVQDNLEQLRATVEMLQNEQANETTGEVQTNVAPMPIPEKNPPPQHLHPQQASSTTTGKEASSSTTVQEPSSSPAAAQSAEATAAIDTAEKKVEQIQSQLDTGQQQLNLANDRVRELTAELNALNDRIKAGNQELSDPTISRSDRFGLLSALLENVQLALSDAETRLEAQTKSPPQTVGHVVISGFGHAVSGAVDVTTQISLSFSQIIENFWHMLFPSY